MTVAERSYIQFWIISQAGGKMILWSPHTKCALEAPAEYVKMQIPRLQC